MPAALKHSRSRQTRREGRTGRRPFGRRAKRGRNLKQDPPTPCRAPESIQSAAMSSKLIDGTALAQQTKREVSDRVAALKGKGRSVHLTAVLVGSTAAGELYAERQRQAC